MHDRNDGAIYEEAHFFHTLTDFEKLVEQYGIDRVMNDMAPHTRLALSSWLDQWIVKEDV